MLIQKASKKSIGVKTNVIFPTQKFSSKRTLRLISVKCESHEFSFFDPSGIEVSNSGLEIRYKIDPYISKIIKEILNGVLIIL